jgi:transposase
MNVRYRVDLSQIERAALRALLSGGKHASRRLKRAQILLAADAGASDEEIARSVGVGGSTVYRTKRRFVEGNLERALSEEPRPGAERKLTGKEEALLVATACTSPPEGRARWTLELLAGAMVKLTEHKSLSHETVRRRLAENDLKPWRKDMWCIPKVDGEYVARMEDVLDSMPKRPIPSGRWCASTKARCNSSVRSVSQSRPGRVSSNVTITSIVAMVRSISSFSSTFIVLGARSKSPSGERQKTTPNACAISSTSIIPMPGSSGSSRIIYRPTRPAPCTRRSRPPKPGGSCDGSSSTTPPSTQAGSTWSRSRSASCAVSAWIAGSTTPNDYAAKSQLGSEGEMPPAASNGCSQPTRPAPKWAAPILPLPKSHNHCAEPLVDRFAQNLHSWTLPARSDDEIK